MSIKIQVVNESTVASDEQIKPIVDALQIQVARDFAPIWGTDAALSFVPKGHGLDSSQWWMVILDDSDQSGALGYHDVTDADLPLGKVFAKDDIRYGSSLSVTISHEILEMLGDPQINACRMNTAGTMLYCYENADAVEDDSLGYKIGDVLVSDFVTPAWFDDAKGHSGPYDFKGHCDAPFQVLQGGYIGYLDLAHPEKGWQQITDEKGREKLNKKQFGSRFERRKRYRDIHYKRVKSAVTR